MSQNRHVMASSFSACIHRFVLNMNESHWLKYPFWKYSTRPSYLSRKTFVFSSSGKPLVQVCLKNITYCVICPAAAYIALRSIVLVELLGVQKLSNSFGILLLFQGIASIAGSPIAGTSLSICALSSASRKS